MLSSCLRQNTYIKIECFFFIKKTLLHSEKNTDYNIKGISIINEKFEEKKSKID